VLRGVERLEIGNANVHDVRRHRSHHNAPIRPHNLDVDLVSELKFLAEGSTPSVFVFTMYEKLLNYAQGFERNEAFRKEMDIPYGKALLRLDPTSRCHAWWGSGKSPFKSYEHPSHSHSGWHPSEDHPVEHYLEVASAASKSNNIEEFLKGRKEVLDYFERYVYSMFFSRWNNEQAQTCDPLGTEHCIVLLLNKRKTIPANRAIPARYRRIYKAGKGSRRYILDDRKGLLL
jgi:hypothetical protein